jgi:putative transposase
MEGSTKPTPDRKNLRLSGYDYSQVGAYFVTIVTEGRTCLFGDIVEGEMRPNPAGAMIVQVCDEFPHILPCMTWGIFQIMPNHFHAIIELNYIVGATLRVALFEPWLPRADTEVCPYGWCKSYTVNPG